jgi:hypothetical protein
MDWKGFFGAPAETVNKWSQKLQVRENWILITAPMRKWQPGIHCSPSIRRSGFADKVDLDAKVVWPGIG